MLGNHNAALWTTHQGAAHFYPLTTMKEARTQINSACTEDFLNSAKNATDKGMAQFFTPRAFAKKFNALLPVNRTLSLDLNSGNDTLLDAVAAVHQLGIDIDPSHFKEATQRHHLQADTALWYDLAARSGLCTNLITINPPFGLQWYTSRLQMLGHSRQKDIASTFQKYHGKETIDSTLASFMMALDLLTYNGEGYMICAHSTAEKLFSPDGKHPELAHHIWAWLKVEGKVFKNIRHTFDTAVIFFSTSHGGHRLTPEVIETHTSTLNATIKALTSTAHLQHRGMRIRSAYDNTHESTLAAWEMVAKEYKAAHYTKVKPAYNVGLSKTGKIITHLTPFQTHDILIPKALLKDLQEIKGKSPMGLVTQHALRMSLIRATRTPFWRVDPEVNKMVDQCLRDYEKLRAPFNTPSPTTSLGWLDEANSIECKTSFGSFIKGHSYPFTTAIEATSWKGKTFNLAGDREDLTYTGNELVVIVTDSFKNRHHYHVRRDKKLPKVTTFHFQGAELEDHHHKIQDLIEHFVIETPADITQQDPELFAQLQARLDQIESFASDHMAKSA